MVGSGEGGDAGEALGLLALARRQGSACVEEKSQRNSSPSSPVLEIVKRR